MKERGKEGENGLLVGENDRVCMVLLSNPDTNETKKSVHVSEVSLFLGLKCTQELFFEKISLLERHRHVVL